MNDAGLFDYVPNVWSLRGFTVYTWLDNKVFSANAVAADAQSFLHLLVCPKGGLSGKAPFQIEMFS